MNIILEKYDREIFKNALYHYIAFLDIQLKYLASCKHKCHECEHEQGCPLYHRYDSEKERTKELLGFLESNS